MPKQLDFTAAFELGGEGFAVRPMTATDLETLRVWKNSNRRAFHHKQEISPEQQRAWYETFSREPDQQMFVLEREGQLIGCVGFRFVGPGVLDLFNLMLGDPGLRHMGLMGAFYRCLEAGLAQRRVRRIELEVLRDNEPAIRFYEKQGFSVFARDERSLAMEKALQ